MASRPTETTKTPEAEVTLEREASEPFVLVPCHALPVVKMMVVGWCCWEAPLSLSKAKPICSMAFSYVAPATIVCRKCEREYGVFANHSAHDGAVVLTTG